MNTNDIISNTDSISLASNSYEMIEYGLNPIEIEGLKTSQRKNCLCNHSDISEYPETFFEEFMSRPDNFYTDTEVPATF